MTQWWRNAVFYQVYPRSFADGNDDGTGDLVGLRSKLPYLKQLGIDALWLSPFYVSPLADGGYDVADPCDVDPMFGTLADFDAMLTDAHALGIRVTVDIVPNHFSEQHQWFQAALAAAPGSPERARFIFRDSPAGSPAGPPNNWPSVFGGTAWTQVEDGQWYLHLFAREQPDLDWTNPEVSAEFERILRFWLDRGVDGFRIDVTHGMAKAAGLPDMAPELLVPKTHDSHMNVAYDPRWDQDEVHDYLRGFRRVLDSYPGDRMAVGEAWVADPRRLALYVRPDELNLSFNFQLLECKWGAGNYRASIEQSLDALHDVGAPCTWVLSNHDVDREVTRYGSLARARAAALVVLSLPGSAYVYNGEELGLANVDLPDAVLQDPTFLRSGGTDRGRDGERVPLPWSGSEPPYGFGTSAATWLPQPADWAPLTAEAQDGDPSSTLSLYRAALTLRPSFSAAPFAWLPDVGEDVLGYTRGDVTVLLNTGATPVPLPAGSVLLASGSLEGGALPTDTAVWLKAS